MLNGIRILQTCLTIAALCLNALGFTVIAEASSITPNDRGAIMENGQLRIVIRDGVLTGLVNKLTGEEYVDGGSDVDELQKVLPSGMGTQHKEEERRRAFDLFHTPWGEHSINSRWANQHHPTSKSGFEFKQITPASARLVYTGLTDGTTVYADESYILNVAIEGNGDVAITPEAHSPRGGVYGVNLTVAPLMPAITVEAPVFDGIRITKDMPPLLWNVLWANYWDYAFVALNGWKKGAIGIWCADKELKFSKSLYHMVNDQGLSLAFHGMSIPPYEKLKEARPVTWKIQAFNKGWSEAVASFRSWRLANVKIAERPEWSKQVSFVNMGVSGGKQWVDLLDAYFEGKHLERTLTFAATIRAAKFDTNHADNTPYEGFKKDMRYWKERGPKLMAYLNPVIMWSPSPKTDRERDGVALSAEAMTVAPFQGSEAKPVAHFDVQHLGHPGWQRWFLDWIKEYVQDYGSDAIYHDEGQKTPLDNRGLVNGMTPTIGRADYHYKAQVENPASAHGVEHQTSANNTGASFGIGGGIHWGTAPSGMRLQRINHASPVSSSLHYPNGTIHAFPHKSEYHSVGSAQKFHWGMDQQERRSEIAGHSIQTALFSGTLVPFDQWLNELWIERTRAKTFVWEGLRPVFPENWEEGVRSYFRAADGGEFRYVDRDWGSALVELEKDGSERMIYGRIHDTTYAKIGKTGAVAGWPVYNEEGPAGLDPTRYYCFDPRRERPTAYFKTNSAASPSFYEGFANRGFVSEISAYLEVDTLPGIGDIQSTDSVVLVSHREPLALWVNGKRTLSSKKVSSQKWVTGPDGKNMLEKTYVTGEFQIDFTVPAKIAVLLEEPAPLAEAEKNIHVRYVNGIGPERHPIYEDAFIQADRPGQNKTKGTSLPDSINITDVGQAGIPGARYDIAIPVTLPDGANQGEMIITAQSSGKQGFFRVQVNGVEQNIPTTPVTANMYQIVLHAPLNEKDPNALIQIEAERQPVLSLAWEEMPPAAKTSHK